MIQQRLELHFVRMRLESIQPPKPFQAEYSTRLGVQAAQPPISERQIEVLGEK
jgi:hypothetical protein